MPTLPPMTEQFQHFLTEVREQFWGDLERRTRQAWKYFFEAVSLRERDAAVGVYAYDRTPTRRATRNGFYERDVVTRFGTIRLRIARKRHQAFCPEGWWCLNAGRRRSPC